MTRKDDSGTLWTREQVLAEVVAIVAALSPGVEAKTIVRKTRFAGDLGWDEWYVLRVIKPVRRRLHETLSDPVVKGLRMVGDLADYVWSKMEDA